jgi:hypothetical protein
MNNVPTGRKDMFVFVICNASTICINMHGVIAKHKLFLTFFAIRIYNIYNRIKNAVITVTFSKDSNEDLIFEKFMVRKYFAFQFEISH